MMQVRRSKFPEFHPELHKGPHHGLAQRSVAPRVKAKNAPGRRANSS